MALVRKEELLRTVKDQVRLLHHVRGAVEEEMTEIQVVSGETTLILHIETYQL